jgi:tRNA(fMet)-specific endonuclease VapC
MICLDTNAVVAFLKDAPSPVLSRTTAALRSGLEVSISSVVLFELWYGVRKSIQQERNAKRIAELISSPLRVLDFNPRDAEEAGEIRAALERQGTPIGSYDILIAAQARSREALLVTANTREFNRVPGLKIEDWTITG